MIEGFLGAAIAFLSAYGYIVVFLWMFADQAALPIPSVPLLIAAGAVAAGGDLNLWLVVAVATLGTILADSLWYLIGRYGGAGAIGYVCKLSLEPDSCVTTTRDAFGRFGAGTLVIAKFLPGVQTLAPASAGFVRAPWAGFLLLDTLGALLFIVPFCVGGYVFQAELAALFESLSHYSWGIGLFIAAVLSVYLIVKGVQWIVFFRGHRLRRLSAEELHARMDSGDPATIVDLRQRMDYELQPVCIPGALRIPIAEIRVRRAEIPARHDIVLVCT